MFFFIKLALYITLGMLLTRAGVGVVTHTAMYFSIMLCVIGIDVVEGVDKLTKRQYNTNT